MRSHKTEAIIIKRRNYGEADRLLTVFTKDHGKVVIKAKGIRRVPSRRSAHVELLNNTMLTLYQGRRYPILLEAEVFTSFDELKKDLEKIGFAFHICELIDGLCPEDQAQQSVFYLLQNTLTRLSFCETKSYEELLMIIHEFEVKLLTLLGYWHNPKKDISDQFDTHSYIENILERRLRSKAIFARLNASPISS